MRSAFVRPLKRVTRRAALACAALLTVTASPSGAQTGRTLIRGVPFAGWHETGLTTYAAKATTNPSIIASQRMLAGYWFPEARSPESLDSAWHVAAPVRQSITGSSVDSLRALVAAGIPIYVEMTLTPAAHPLSPAATALLAAKKVSVPGAANVSGLLGAMVPAAELPAWTARLGVDPARDRRMAAARVVVGFDDARGVVIVHDPSFGPALEMAKDEFDTAWRGAGASMMFLLPPGASAASLAHAKAPAYRARTAAERSAEAFARVYGLDAAGQFAAAERIARDALTGGADAPDGYRHVLNLELALALRAQNKGPEAIAALEEALKWVSDSPLAWQALSQLYRKNGADGRLADYAAKMASDLAKDPGVPQRLAGLLPSDLLLVPFLDLRGWCGN